MPTITADHFWAGTENSLALAEQAEAKILAGSFDQAQSAASDTPRLYQLTGGVGVVSITGSLTNRDSWMNEFFGVTSYNEVRAALDYAANDTAAKEILLYVDSGGGAVSGVSDTSALIKRIDAVKPVTTFTDGTMASAAYWLGSSAREVYNSDTSMVGSIGVILTHKDYSQAYKDAGINVTVMRAGRFKALANSNEPLSDPAKAQLQDQLDATYGVFIGAVADNIGMSKDQADKLVGQGREFVGQRAVDIGLSSGVTTLDKLVSKMQGRIDKRGATGSNSMNVQSGTNDMKRILTEQQLAALAAGADPAAVQAMVAAPTEGEGVVPPVVVPAAAASTEPAAAAPAAVVEPTAAAPAAADAGVVTFLQTQLKAAQDDLVALRVEMAGKDAKIAGFEAHRDALVEIAAGTLKSMNVALNLPAVDVSAMSLETVLSSFTATKAMFVDKFKAGGVAVTSDKPKLIPAVDPLRMKRVQATQAR